MTHAAPLKDAGSSVCAPIMPLPMDSERDPTPPDTPAADADDSAASDEAEPIKAPPGSIRDAVLHASPYIIFVLLTTLSSYTPDSWTVWIDPFRTVLTAGALLFLVLRGTYPELKPRPRNAPYAFWLAVAAGVFVGLFWVPLAHATPMMGEEARTGFNPAHAGETWGTPLLAMRLLGMILVVPFAEELFVRSLLPRFWDTYQDGGDWRKIGIGIMTPMAFLVSVGFFTLTHPEWMAAVATGLIWTVLVMYTRRIEDSILAHVIANTMLGGYIVVMEAYELW